QGRRERRRAIGARPADLPGGRRRPRRERRPDPDPLRGRDRRARADPRARRRRRPDEADLPEPRRQDRRPGLSPRALLDGCVLGGPGMSHEPLLTSVVGSHAHPGWFAAGIAAAERGEFGPADLAEMLDDGVDVAIRDQEAAGIDIVSDGEMRRAGFFTAEFYRHLTGMRALPPDRLLGAGAHDALHRFAVDEPIAAPNGLGVVGEYVAARSR